MFLNCGTVLLQVQHSKYKSVQKKKNGKKTERTKKDMGVQKKDTGVQKRDIGAQKNGNQTVAWHDQKAEKDNSESIKLHPSNLLELNVTIADEDHHVQYQGMSAQQPYPFETI